MENRNDVSNDTYIHIHNIVNNFSQQEEEEGRKGVKRMTLGVTIANDGMGFLFVGDDDEGSLKKEMIIEK